MCKKREGAIDMYRGEKRKTVLLSGGDKGLDPDILALPRCSGPASRNEESWPACLPVGEKR